MYSLIFLWITYASCSRKRYNAVMSYEIGTYVPLEKVNQPLRATFQDETKKERYDYTFEKIGQTLKAIRHIPVVAY